VTESWQTVPENNPDRLKAMRAAYLFVINPGAMEPHDAALFHAAAHGDPGYTFGQGWVGVGCRWDVPKHPWLVAHYGQAYVWVMPEHAAEFSRFVLLILHIETLTPGGGGGPAARAMPTPATPLEAPSYSPFQPRLFDVPTGVNSTLFFVPRGRR
jgi:hypothetical protein